VIRLTAVFLIAIAATLAGAGYVIRVLNPRVLWEAPVVPRARTVQLDLSSLLERDPESEPAATVAEAAAASTEEPPATEELLPSEEPVAMWETAAPEPDGDSADLVRRMISLYERNRALE